jgi:dTDP-4-amino-4,6-dideoxygalactose transaminase
MIERFERALGEATGANYAVAVTNGTAALHLAVLAAGFQSGDHGLTSAITFAATANSIAFAGGHVHFSDVNPETALVDLQLLGNQLKALVSAGTPPKVILPVDMGGQCADLPTIRRLADSCGARVIEDAAHSLGAAYEENGKRYQAGSCVHSDMAILSFHPVKHITTGEGGAVLTNDQKLADRLRKLRNHGIHKDPLCFERPDEGPWYYEQDQLGFNYRLTDIQCAMGLSQLNKLDRFLDRRREIAATYDQVFSKSPLSEFLRPLEQVPDRLHAYHLYVVRLVRRPGEDLARIAQRRKELYLFLRNRGIFTQVHYIPVNWHPYYQRFHGTSLEDCLGANTYYASCLSLPIYPLMGDGEIERVVEVLHEWSHSRSSQAPRGEY